MKRRFSRHITGCLLTAVAAVQFAPALRADNAGLRLANAVAQTNKAKETPTILAPGSSLHGKTYAEWSEAWWKWALGTTASINPLVTGECNPLGRAQNGAVWFLWTAPTTINCTVPAGKEIFVPIINAECSSVEGFPYAGPTPEAAVACAKLWNDQVTNLTATVDEEPVANIYAYRFATPPFSFRLPEDNLFGLPAKTVVNSAADGFYLMLQNLSPGTHTIHLTGNAHYSEAPGADFSVDTNINLTIGK